MSFLVWMAVFVGLEVIAFVFALAMCKAAGRADEAIEKILQQEAEQRNWEREMNENFL